MPQETMIKLSYDIHQYTQNIEQLKAKQAKISETLKTKETANAAEKEQLRQKELYITVLKQEHAQLDITIKQYTKEIQLKEAQLQALLKTTEPSKDGDVFKGAHVPLGQPLETYQNMKIRLGTPRLPSKRQPIEKNGLFSNRKSIAPEEKYMAPEGYSQHPLWNELGHVWSTFADIFVQNNHTKKRP